MPYLIDSDWIIDLLADVPEAVGVVDELAGDGIAISMITYMEVYQGTLRTADPVAAQQSLHTLLEDVPVLPLSFAVAKRCAQLRETLKRSRKRVRARALDLLVAATALEHDLTLVTRNTEDYSDIPGLSIHSRPTGVNRHEHKESTSKRR
jgi:tRNA(fMet)-specific endonuclease VapC